MTDKILNLYNKLYKDESEKDPETIIQLVEPNLSLVDDLTYPFSTDHLFQRQYYMKLMFAFFYYFTALTADTIVKITHISHR